MDNKIAKRILMFIALTVIAAGIALGFIYSIPVEHETYTAFSGSRTTIEYTFNFQLMFSVWIGGAAGLVLPCALITGVIQCLNKISDDLQSLKKKAQDIADVNPMKGWICPKCGKVNQNNVGSCGCGEQKPQ
ncbi:MAG: hypothetical protein ACI4IS_00405 [Acutalibacteraceae bacterium]